MRTSVLTSVVVSADETDARVTLGQTHKALVSTVQGTARKPASTSLLLAVARRRLGRRSATVACPSVMRLLSCLVFFHLRVVWIVVAVVAERRRLFSSRCRLPGVPFTNTTYNIQTRLRCAPYILR